MDREQALDMALGQIERQFGKGSVMKMNDQAAVAIPAIPPINDRKMDSVSTWLTIRLRLAPSADRTASGSGAIKTWPCALTRSSISTTFSYSWEGSSILRSKSLGRF